MNQQLSIMRPMRYRLLYYLLSLIILVPGTYSLATRGLRLGIDFTGGSQMVWQGDNLTQDSLESRATPLGVTLIEAVESGGNWHLTTSPLTSEQHNELVPPGVKELSYSNIGPTLGRELIQKTLSALALASLLILLYVATRFKNVRYGSSAVLAMLHDILVVLGVFSLLRIEVDTLFVTALLTILSFSVHDTIVVYDRIRELQAKHGYLEFEDIVNRAVVETMGRSLNNSMTIIFMLLALYLLGGTTINHFVLALLVGTVSGTYSSTFTAAPLLVTLDKLAARRSARRLKSQKTSGR